MKCYCIVLLILCTIVFQLLSSCVSNETVPEMYKVQLCKMSKVIIDNPDTLLSMYKDTTQPIRVYFEYKYTYKYTDDQVVTSLKYIIDCIKQTKKLKYVTDGYALLSPNKLYKGTKYGNEYYYFNRYKDNEGDKFRFMFKYYLHNGRFYLAYVSCIAEGEPLHSVD